MADFQLDTSGEVGPISGARYGSPGCTIDAARSFYRWPDLTPFVQGYVRAQAAEVAALLAEAFGSDWNGLVSFDMWAPETLARIIEDCAAVQEIIDSYPGRPDLQQAQGRDFYAARQNGKWSVLNQIVRFPPLTLSLNDDGKVVFL